MNTILNRYKEMSINKNELCKQIGDDLYNIENINPVCVNTIDVNNAIEKFLRKEIELQELVDWVNVIWFTELFYFPDEETDAIISVMEVLETLDEEDINVSCDDLKNMQETLANNKEYTN
jgi:hypothetical protein